MRGSHTTIHQLAYYNVVELADIAYLAAMWGGMQIDRRTAKSFERISFASPADESGERSEQEGDDSESEVQGENDKKGE